MLTNAIYLAQLKQFPNINLSNMKFIISCILLLVNHSVWFKHFTSQYYSFNNVFAFFLVCVWTIPFTFLIGLTSGDETLPYGATITASGEADGKKYKKPKLILTLLDKIKQPLRRFLPGEREPYKTF
eukprot:TRINITY_DN3297_c0_g1_i2.p1 TRINITY_DN3297_c0_g1~~TRINITY_DN3297_c0_g1_i2.p1  ORF type:complete len:127 (+),score=9.60 TRINITY_DN3297_c0_g1_i2:296-676(+)